MNLKRIPESQGWIQRIGEWAIRQHTFMPRMIDLEVSRVCNLKCPACVRTSVSSMSQKGGEPFCTLERFRNIHKEIPTIGTLNFMGDGEPLVNPEFNDIIHYAFLSGIYTVITSNTTLITPKHIKHWEENNVYRIHASIDAPKKDLYEDVRVGATWEGTYKILQQLGTSSIPVCVNMLLTKSTISEMLNMVKLCKEIGIKEVTFLMPICPHGNDIDTRVENNVENRQLFLDTSRLCNKLGIKWIFPLTLNPTFRRFNFPFIRPQISIEGDIWACCYSLGRGKNWVFGHCIDLPEKLYDMGNMFKEGFREVWFGEGFKEIREVYRKTELPKGTVISKEEYLKRVKEIEKRTDRFAHCEICPARWGVACS